MKIALLSEKYTPDIGGLAISTERYANLLASAGYTPRLFIPTSSLPPSEKQTLTRHGISVTRFGVHKRVDDTLVDWFELIVEEHARDPFDLIHAYYLTQAGFVGVYAGKYLNLPSVVSIRGNDIERSAFDPGKFSHVMYTLQHADAVTTNASGLVKKAKAFIGREIHFIPNGIDTNLFKKIERNPLLAGALGIEAGSKVAGFSGELRAKKGLQTLLNAYAQAAKQTKITLLVVGEVRQGEDKKQFDEFKNQNPQLNIVVTGAIPHKELPAYYALMDVFIHPSLRDGMPNALLEAMACELPIIATPVGGVLDVVDDSETGFIIPVNEAKKISEKILDLVHDPGLCEQIGKSARERIKARFTPEKELNANLELYKKLR